MSMLMKASAAVFGSIGAVYGAMSLATISHANSEVDRYKQKEKEANRNLKVWETDLQANESKIVNAESESQEQEVEVSKLQKQLRVKEEEADCIRTKLAEASASLASKLDAVGAARRATRELHAKITSGRSILQAAAESHKVALAKKDEQIRALNPLAHPEVQALFGR